MATELAKAYVQIVPSVQGISSDLDDSLQDIMMSANGAENEVNAVGDAAGSTSGDLDSLSSDTSTADDKMGGLADSAGTASGDLAGMGDAAVGASGDLSGMASDASTAGGDLNALGSDASGADSAIDSLADALISASASLDDAADGATGASDAMDTLSGSADDAADSVDDAGAAADGTDFDALAGSVDNASDSMDSMGDSSAGATSSLWDLGGELGGDLVSGSSEATNMFGAFSDVANEFATGGVAAGIIAAIGEVVEGLIEIGKEAKTASVNLAQMTGASGEELQEFQDIAKEALKEVDLASSTSLDDMSKVVGELSTRCTQFAKEDLSGVSASVADFAAITGTDAVTAVDDIANIMNTWGLEASDLPGLLDDLTTAGQESGISIDSLASTLADNKGQFDSLGLSIEDATAYITAYDNVNQSSGDLTRALRSAVTNLTGEVDDVPGAFQAAMEAIENAENSTEALTASVGDTGLTVEDVFGATNAQKLANVLQSEAYDIDSVTAAFAENSGQMNQTAADSTRMSDRVKSVTNDVKVGLMNTGEAIKDSVTGTEALVAESGTVMADSMEASVEDLSAAAMDEANAITDTIDTSLGIAEGAESTVMQEKGDSVASGFADGMSSMAEEVEPKLDATIADIDEFGIEAEASLDESSDAAASAVEKGYGQVGDSVDRPLANAFKSIVQWGTDSGASIKNSTTQLVNDASAGMSGMPGQVQAQLTNTQSNITQWGSNISTDATNTAKKFVTNFQTGMSTLSNKVSSILSATKTTISGYESTMKTAGTSLGKNLVQGMINGLDNKSSSLYSKVQSIVDTAIRKANSEAQVGSPSKKMMWTGEMMGEGLALGIQSEVSTVNTAMDRLMAATDRQPTAYSYGGTGNTNEACGTTYNITQNIYSQAQTAAELMKEARYEARRAVICGV